MTDALENERKKIDQIDQKISQLLIQRLETVSKIGKIKKQKGLNIKDQDREEKVLKKFQTPYEKNIFKTIIVESIKAQEALTKKG